MHRVLLMAAASITALAASSPASAQNVATAGFSSSSESGRIQFVTGRSEFRGNLNSGHRRHIHVGGRGFGFGYGSGYNDYGDYDANRSFDPDKWNDWWHNRPDRAFPRWVWSNQGCSEDRMWSSGSGWRCTP